MTVQLKPHHRRRARQTHVGPIPADLLGLQVSPQYGPFVPVAIPNGVTLDYMDHPGSGGITPQHYAFLVSEDDFDAIFGRIREAGLTYWADRRIAARARSTRTTAPGTYFETRTATTWRS